MKKKSLIFIFYIVVAFLSMMSTQNVVATSIDITADVHFKDVPKEVVVGDSGKFWGEIGKVQGLNVKGTIKYKTSDSNVLSTTSNGDWIANSVGEVTITPQVTLSNESMQALKDKFPGDTLVTRDIVRVLTIRVTKKSSSVYRIYNPNSGEHFYTMNAQERDNLKNHGWRYEGIGWRSPHQGIPIYRSYNPNSGEHFYTMNTYERDNLKRQGWRYEGISWYTDMSGIPVYRLYNKNDGGPGAHHYTSNVEERDSLKRIGWIYEGVSWNGK
ncbi:hypothetical protein [Enterococcus gilvus]|uniref:hypothetical protein n=1 Tax=Enterococcus gilvus TaxID=160453 RepID=UPI003744ABB7